MKNCEIEFCSNSVPKNSVDFVGWNEPTTTNALVQDEAIQVVSGDEPKTHPPLPKDFGFFNLLFAPKAFLSYLLPTYFTSFCVHSIIKVQRA
jgi:hypothetical protein